MSCHSTAEYKAHAPLSPLFDPKYSKDKDYQPGTPGWMQWFRNLPCGTPFDDEAKSMDFSLQLAASLQNFKDWKAQQGGLFSAAYPQPKVLKSSTSAVKEQAKPVEKKVYKIDFLR